MNWKGNDFDFEAKQGTQGDYKLPMWNMYAIHEIQLILFFVISMYVCMYVYDYVDWVRLYN